MKESLIVATQNAGKMAEFKRILEPFGFDVKSMSESGYNIDIEETGTTFSENAKIKSEGLWKIANCYTIADDSGLCITALDDAPGVLSARYMGHDTPYSVKNRGILAAMATVSHDARDARFVSAIAFTNPAGETKIFEGTCEGVIGYEAIGERGFGYDPIFMVGDRSYAQLEDHEKDEISHRGKALKEFRRFLEDNGVK